MRIERSEGLDCAAIAAASALPLFLLAPLRDHPFVDDWAYAWSVRHLLETGRLAQLEYSTALFAHTLWGALFCLPFGFSFVALQLSTWVLAVAALCSLYLLLRELDVERGTSLLGAAALGAYPIFFVLSFSFMTDVPALAWSSLGCLAFVRALKRRSGGWLAAAAAFASLAAGVRVTALGLAAAMLVVLWLGCGPWGRSWRRWSLLALPFAITGLMLVWRFTHVVVTADMSLVVDRPADRITHLELYAVPHLPRELVASLGFAVGVFGLALLPVTIAIASSARRRTAGLVLLGLGALLAVGWISGIRWDPPWTYGQTWTLDELGATAPLVPGEIPQHATDGMRWAGWAIGLVSVVVFLAQQIGRRRRPAITSAQGAASFSWAFFLGAFLAIQYLVVALLWLSYDRYLLSWVPPAIALALASGPTVRRRASIVVVAAYTALSLVGSRDLLRYDAAFWRALDDLRSRGVAVSDIDAGYVANGWLQYADPEHAHRDASGSLQIPYLNSTVELTYRVSNDVPAGWVELASYGYRRWLGRSGAIHLLRRPP